MRHIIDADLRDPRVVSLLNSHVTNARANTAAGSAHALNLDALELPGIAVWAIWEGQQLLAIGALKQLSPGHGEVKSMYTEPSVRRGGTGSIMLRHIIDKAYEAGMSRLSLETGSWDYFLPAHAFYRRHGFEECPPFGDYRPDPNSIFMSLNLGAA